MRHPASTPTQHSKEDGSRGKGRRDGGVVQGKPVHTGPSKRKGTGRRPRGPHGAPEAGIGKEQEETDEKRAEGVRGELAEIQRVRDAAVEAGLGRLEIGQIQTREFAERLARRETCKAAARREDAGGT